MATRGLSWHVTLVSSPDALASPLSGLYETFHPFRLLASFQPDLPEHPFIVNLVALSRESVRGASGLSLGAHRTHGEVERTDIAIVPLMMVRGPDRVPGRYPRLVHWLRRMDHNGAIL